MSIQRYTNRTTPDGVWLDKADDGDWALYADKLAELTAERERADRAEGNAARWQREMGAAVQDQHAIEVQLVALRERVARLEQALDEIESDTYDTSIQAIARTALEGK